MLLQNLGYLLGTPLLPLLLPPPALLLLLVFFHVCGGGRAGVW